MFRPEIKCPPPAPTSSLHLKGLNIRSHQNTSGPKSCSSAGPAFWKCVLCHHTGPVLRRILYLGLCFAVTVLKFLTNFEQRTTFLNVVLCTAPCKLCSQSCPLRNPFVNQSVILRGPDDQLQSVARALPHCPVTGKLS